MRRRMHFKIAKFAVSEMLIQAGFERAMSEALDTLADVFCYHIERSLRKVRAIQDHRKAEGPVGLSVVLLEVDVESYRFSELLSFLSTQVHLSTYVEDRLGKSGSSMLQMLRILPQNMCIRGAGRECSTGPGLSAAAADEDKEVVVDSFMKEYVEKSLNKKRDAPRECEEEDVSTLNVNICALTGAGGDAAPGRRVKLIDLLGKMRGEIASADNEDLLQIGFAGAGFKRFKMNSDCAENADPQNRNISNP